MRRLLHHPVNIYRPLFIHYHITNTFKFKFNATGIIIQVIQKFLQRLALTPAPAHAGASQCRAAPGPVGARSDTG